MHFADIPSRHARGRGPTVKLRSRLMEKCPMNLKTTTLVLIMTGIGVLAGCSSPSVVQTRDGGQVVTPDEPQYNEDTGFYEYDKDGHKVQVNKDDVKTIEEVK